MIANALLAGLACGLLSVRYLLAADAADWSAWTLAFYGLLAPATFFVFLLVPGLALALPGWLAERLRPGRPAAALAAALFLADWLAFALVLADTFVYEQFRQHLNVAMLQMTFLGGGQIVRFSAAMTAEIAALALGCALAAWACARLAWAAARTRFPAKAALALALALFAGTQLAHAWAFAAHKSDFVDAAQLLPGGTRMLHCNRVLMKLGVVDRAEVYRVRTDAGKGMNYPLKPLAFEPRKLPNIVFILLDSVRADMLSPEVMPRTWDYAMKNIRFTDHISGGINTRHGVYTLFTGLPGSYWEKSLASQKPAVLIEALLQRGYAAGVFAGAGLDMPEFNQAIFSTVPGLRVRPRGEGALERDAAACEDMKAFIDASRAAGKPFFAMLFLDNVHAYAFPEDDAHAVFKPYWKTINYLELKNGFDPAPYFNRYKNAVRYADGNVGAMLDFLAARGLEGDTVVLISSDHGEEFNDNGQNYWEHNGNFTAVQSRVPLVIHWPGRKPAVNAWRTSGLDIVPTLMADALGCTNPLSDYTAGRSLWQDAGRPFVYVSNYSQNAFVEKDRLVVINQAGVMQFKDLRNRKSADGRVPPYMARVLEETSRWAR
ncbi:MAG: sulfatase-like hydrolase/transferase [Duodenibacillus sp.]|nr:sulfatase-like hydrolase/transferase [Duodenibacillus sp.]